MHERRSAVLGVPARAEPERTDIPVAVADTGRVPDRESRLIAAAGFLPVGNVVTECVARAKRGVGCVPVAGRFAKRDASAAGTS